MLLQAATAPSPSWPRAAIHDTVAAIVRQLPYRRDIQNTLLDRLLQSIDEAFARLFGALRGVPHGRQAAVVAAVVLALLVVARIVYAARLRTGVERRRTVFASGAEAADPWREAEHLAREGRYTDAAHALYRATLAGLAARGLVRLHESKTTGDYARELRRRTAASYAVFRRFGSRFDRIIYGTGSCDAESYDALLADARAVLDAGRSERAA